MSRITALLNARTYLFALALTIALIIANVVALPDLANPSSYAATLGELAPFALVAVASTPAILSGGGGIDLSIAPLTGLIAVVYVVGLLPHGLGQPEIAIPIALAIGAAIGALNGTLVAVLRYQPVIATLCTFFILSGVAAAIAPTPQFAAPNWANHLAGSVGPVPGAVLSVGIPLLIWLALRRTAFVRTLMAVGGSDTTAFSSGVNIIAVRIAAYTLGGALAAFAAFAVTGLVREADPTLAPQFTLIALAAVALGGTPLGGGRGGLVGPVLGASCIYFIENLLTVLHVNATWLQVVYGGVLVIAVVLSARLTAARSQAVAG